MTPVIKNEASRICFGLLQTVRSHVRFMYVWCLSVLASVVASLQAMQPYKFGTYLLGSCRSKSCSQKALELCLSLLQRLWQTPTSSGSDNVPREGQTSPTVKSLPHILSMASIEMHTHTGCCWATDTSWPPLGISDMNSDSDSRDRPLLFVVI